MCLNNTIQVTAPVADCHGKAVPPHCIEFSAPAGSERVCGMSRDSMSSLMNGGKLVLTNMIRGQ